MNELYALGSIVKFSDSTYMIIGYGEQEDGEYIEPHYLVVPIPFGYMENESIRILLLKEDIELIKEGYKDKLGENYLNSKTKWNTELKKYTTSEWSVFSKELWAQINEMEVPDDAGNA